jgi:hypothetical protein
MKRTAQNASNDARPIEILIGRRRNPGTALNRLLSQYSALGPVDPDIVAKNRTLKDDWEVRPESTIQKRLHASGTAR